MFQAEDGILALGRSRGRGDVCKRQESTHTNLYLTESIARAAVAVTTQARDDFVKEWLEHFYPERQWPAGPSATNAPDWDNLCSWCGIDFLPLYRADERKEGEE